MSVRATNALLRFARRWFDERTVSSVFEPLLADHQREWLDAPAVSRARVAMRTAAAFLMALITMSPRALFLTPTPPSITRRVIARMILFISVTSGLMMIPFFNSLSVVPAGHLFWLVVWLLPSTVLVAFPFAMGFSVDGIRRYSTPTPADRLAMVRAALAAVAFTIVLQGWIVPATNQQFRLTVWGDRTPPPARGARELTTPQLFEAPWLARAEGRERPAAIQREMHTRASFAVLPVILIWMRWRALQRPSPQWLLPAWLEATVTIGLFLGIGFAAALFERSWNLFPGVSAWIPIAALAGAGLARDHFAKRAAA